MTVYTATLSGSAEAPPNNSPGTGTCTVTVDLDLVTMRVQVDFSGTLGNISACHIHGLTALPMTGTASVMTPTPSFPSFPHGGTSGSYDRTFDMSLASSYNASFVTASGSVSAAFGRIIQSLDESRAYLNVHSSMFPGGEIRGFLVAVPPCVGDFNESGGVDGDDVIDFFSQWDASSDSSDVNGDGGVDGDEVIFFFEAWDAGC